jgi:integrase
MAGRLSYSQGIPLHTVGAILGHSTEQMTKRYSHLAPESIRQALEKGVAKRDTFRDTGRKSKKRKRA